MRHRRLCIWIVVLLASLSLASLIRAYPLSGFDHTGIRRLWAYDPARRATLGGPSLPPGALMPLQAVELQMLENRDYDVTAETPKDPELQAGLEDIFRGRDPGYSIAVLDITETHSPRYAALNAGREYIPGSVGKLLVGVGLFDALRDTWPDPQERLRVLRETRVTADEFIRWDSHSVPIVDMDEPSLIHRPIEVGDEFTLFEWIDHAFSPSSNAAGSTTWKEAMLIRAFGKDYPPSPEEEGAWFESMSGTQLQELAVRTIVEPLRESGLDPDALRKGTMFTDVAKQRVPGVRSYASPRELTRLLLRMEQGRLVDEFSSLELKRLLYFTRNRYRYASSPALREAAVYFKSGSFYVCEEEEGYECSQYAGNEINIMNSVATVESPANPAAGETQRIYLTGMMSNVLKINSAVEHQSIATYVERLIEGIHAEEGASSGS